MEKTCYLCKSNENDELLYGKFYTKWNLSVHYYCLLLSSNLVQHGVSDSQGIFGFLEADIRKENERTKSCRCYICKQMHANVFCCAKKCLRTFHTVCGVKNRCLSHFTGTFQSWCASHIPLKPESTWHPPEEQCSICYEEMGRYDKITSIRAPCCKNGWFHQQCVARFAQTSGYFFKCPLCNNVETFMQKIPLRGIFVPERDAAWELEPNAFQEQLERPSACDAEECKCEEGRETDNRHWDLLICGSCGSTSRHRECMESPESRTYVCICCRPIIGEDISKFSVNDKGNENDNDDDTDDEASNASSPDNVNCAGNDAQNSSQHCSAESGVQCSSGDESVLKPRRLQKKRSIIHSESSDSDVSEISSTIIRRGMMRIKGKRARLMLSEASDETDNRAEEEDSVASRTPRRSCIGTTVAEQLDENSNTSGTSSISVGRNRVRPARKLAGKRCIDTSDDSDSSAISRKKLQIVRSSVESKMSLRSSPAPATAVQTSANDSEDSDDLPLYKRRRVSAREICQRPSRTGDTLNTSNEENIQPQGRESTHDNKPSTHSIKPTSGVSNVNDQNRENDDKKLASQCRHQQSILKFISQTSRNTPSKTPANDSDSVGSSAEKLSASGSATSKRSKLQLRNSTSTNSEETDGAGGSRKKKARRRRKAPIVEKKGQILNYFNRC